jgi:hypothetical protein
VLQGITLLILNLFYQPPVSRLLIPLMVRLYGESSLHYPQYYAYLPRLYSTANVWILNPLTSWFFIGAATLMFAARYRGRVSRVGSALGGALRRVVPLLGVGLIEWGVLKAFVELFAFLNIDVLDWGAMSPRLFLLVSFGLHVIFIVPFAFTSAEVVLSNKGIWDALRGSFRLARRNFGVTYCLFAVPSLLTLVASYISGRTDLILFRFNPEVIVFLLILSILVTLLVNFIIVGSLTALYLQVTERIE